MKRIAFSCAVIALALSACGPKANSPIGDAVRGVAEPKIREYAGLPPKAEGEKSVPLSVQIIPAGAPVRLNAIPAVGITGEFRRAAVNNGIETWTNEAGISLIFRDRILIGTRGFGDDLMGANAPTLSQIRAGAGTVSRQIEYLDGVNQIQRYNLSCTLTSGASEAVEIQSVSYNARLVKESCSGDAYVFENKYWFGADGGLLRSLQLISPTRGHLVAQ